MGNKGVSEHLSLYSAATETRKEETLQGQNKAK